MPDLDLLPSRIRPMDNELIAAIVAVLLAAAGWLKKDKLNFYG